MTGQPRRIWGRARGAVLLAAIATGIGASAQPAAAASSKACQGSGFALVSLPTEATV